MRKDRDRKEHKESNQWNSKILNNFELSLSKDRDSNFLVMFSSSKVSRAIEKGKRWPTDVGHNSWWHMKYAQHAAHNPKFKKIIQTPPVLAIKKLKDPPIWLKVATTLEKHPTPAHNYTGGKPLLENFVFRKIWALFCPVEGNGVKKFWNPFLSKY